MQQPARFTWKTADGTTNEFELTAAEISIGRAPTCDIVLPDDQMVSRRHAVVRRQGTTYTIVDLGSSNGTLINGVEIHDAATLKDGDRVTIGDQDLSFSAAQETADVAPAVPFGIASTSYGNSSSMPLYAPAPPAPFEPAAPAPQGYEAFSVQDTGALGTVSADAPSTNGYGSDRSMDSYRSSSTYDAPPRQDAASLLATIQSLHAQLSDQVAAANSAADQIRSGIRAALAQLDAALNSAQSSGQRSAMQDLQQLAHNVSQTQQIAQVANLASRADEVRDVLAAHQQLLDALSSIRQQLMQTLNG
jgi:hypothetical protein